MRLFSKFILLSTFFVLCYSVHAQEIGLQLHSLKNQFTRDVPATLAKVKSFGVKEVELTETYGLQFPELIKLLAQNQLQVISFGADFERLANFPQSVADDARSYGAKFVVCSWIPHQGDTFSLEDAKKAVTVFNKAGRIMAQNGLLFCYHPHAYEFQSYEKGTYFDYLIKTFDTRYVYLKMDVFWIKQAGQDPLALLKKHSSRWILLNLKDRKKGTKNSVTGHADPESSVVLGKGDVGIAEIMKEAKTLGIKHIFIDDESPKAEEQIPKSIAYLKTL
ncbi:MAG TPA: sugar phosphate isomerase/epimerase [Ohtaekwangia sp.]